MLTTRSRRKQGLLFPEEGTQLESRHDTGQEGGSGGLPGTVWETGGQGSATMPGATGEVTENGWSRTASLPQGQTLLCLCEPTAFSTSENRTASASISHYHGERQQGQALLGMG